MPMGLKSRGVGEGRQDGVSLREGGADFLGGPL